MSKLKDQVDKVSKTIEETGKRTSIMDKKLSSLEEISSSEANDILGIEEKEDFSTI